MKFAAEVLTLLLMIMSNGRVFTIKNSKIDSLVMLSPIAFVTAVLTLFAFEADLFAIVILFVAILVLFSNFHALSRISSHLYVDHYSVLMKVWGVITVSLSALILGALIFFKPEYAHHKAMNVAEEKTYYRGTFTEGFEEINDFKLADVFMTKFYSSTKTDENSPIVIFMSDKRGNTSGYRPFLQYLAQYGVVVYSCDFYAKDGRWLHTAGDSRIFRKFGFIILSLANNHKFMAQKEFYTYNITREFEEMIKMLSESYGQEREFFIVTDYMGFDAAGDIQKKYPRKISGIFDISTVEEYSTPGYGFVAQTDPLLAVILGQKIDRSGFFTRYVALKTKESLTRPE